MSAVLGGWVLFRCETLSHAGAYFAALSGAGVETGVKYPVSMLVDNLSAATLAVAIVGAMPLGRRLAATIDARFPHGPPRQAAMALEFAWLGAVLLVSCAFLAAGTYNPFIYFRF